MIPTLDAIAEDPGLVRELTPVVCGALVARTAGVLAALSSRLAEEAERGLGGDRDELLDVRAAARLLGTSPRTIWRKRGHEPYASLIRSNGTARLRLSSRAIAEYLMRGPGRRTFSAPPGATGMGRPRVLSSPREKGTGVRP